MTINGFRLMGISGDALIEFVVGCQFRLRICFTLTGKRTVPARKTTRRRHARWRDRITKADEDLRANVASVMRVMMRILSPHLGHMSGSASYIRASISAHA